MMPGHEPNEAAVKWVQSGSGFKQSLLALKQNALKHRHSSPAIGSGQVCPIQGVKIAAVEEGG